jgi:hypothetical protein
MQQDVFCRTWDVVYTMWPLLSCRFVKISSWCPVGLKSKRPTKTARAEWNTRQRAAVGRFFPVEFLTDILIVFHPIPVTGGQRLEADRH